MQRLVRGSYDLAHPVPQRVNTASWQGDPSVLGEPTIVAGGVRIWNLSDDLRLLATLDPLVTDVTYSPILTDTETDND